jgi:hypothetical protein
MAAAADKEAAEEAVVTRATEEAVEKATADKEAASKRTVNEATMKGATVGVAGDSLAPGQAPSLVAGTKRSAAPPRRLNDLTGTFGNLGLSTPPFIAMLHSEYISFSHSSSSSGAATTTGTAAPAAGTTAAEAAVGVTPGSATNGEPQTPGGSLKTC